MKPWKPTTTQLDCIKAYADRAGEPVEEVLKHRLCLPCACEEEGCRGWAMIMLDPAMIADHNLFHSPNEERN